MRRTIRNTLALFDRRERFELFSVFAAVLLVAIFEVVGIASIMPFLSVVSTPELIHEQYVLQELWRILDPGDVDTFLFMLGLMVFILIIITNLFNALAYWLMQRFIWMRHHTLGTRLLDSYLHQPWSFFLNRNTSELSTNILSEVQQFVAQFLMSAIQLFAQGLAGSLIVCLLLAIDPVLALMVSAIVGGVYVLIFFFVRNTQVRLGETRRKTNAERYKYANEAMGGIKVVKVGALESSFLAKYETPSRQYSMSQAKNAVIALTPRYFLEVLGFGAVMLILLYELRVQGTASNVIPVVGLYAFAGFRLLPKMQAMFYAGSNMRFTSEILEQLRNDLIALNSTRESSASEVATMQSHFGLRGVTFTYEGADAPAIDAVDLRIKRRTSVALVGSTGSGKTTCVDLLLGLLTPDEGSIEVDDVGLNDAMALGWRRQCGYVPQQIFLTDDTIAGNIAFGVPCGERDMEAVRKAARIAAIDEFIEEELSQGYETIVGERGVRLSGGQRQRIGIARALYSDPEVLVFDEATSALDNVTERAIMKAIEDLAGKKTLVMVAHRLETVRKCNLIFVFEQGSLVDVGTWEELAERCPQFVDLIHEESTS